MMPGLYRFFLYPLAFGILQIFRPILGNKAKQMVIDKNNHFFEVKNKNAEWIAAHRPFWIHAASGEIEYARPVIRELKNKFPNIPVIVTFSSPSAKKIIKSLADVDAWGSLPWDFHSDCTEFVEKWQPRAWLIARTDVWPVMATVCQEKNIPSLLFAATFAENSSRLRGASAKITAWALNQLSEVHCVSIDDVKQLERLHLQVPVHVLVTPALIRFSTACNIQSRLRMSFARRLVAPFLLRARHGQKTKKSFCLHLRRLRKTAKARFARAAHSLGN